jgi:hypothetical protein
MKTRDVNKLKITENIKKPEAYANTVDGPAEEIRYVTL